MRVNPYRLSICVPTYNRRTHLISLYESIVNQQFNDIQLVITDDGSTDDTSEMISSWTMNDGIHIKHIYQENAGRPTALKKALMEATGEFTVIMDDDLFVPDAFELIKSSLNDLSKKNNQIREIAGICGLCLNEEGDIIGDLFPKNEMISSYYDIRFKKKIIGDKKEIVRTNIIKDKLYRTFENERRVPTSTLWYSVSQDYDMIFINQPFAIKYYLSKGMTEKNRFLRISSPNSHIQHAITIINSRKPSSILMSLRYSIILWTYFFWGGEFFSDQISRSRLWIVYSMLPFGFIFHSIERFKYRFD